MSETDLSREIRDTLTKLGIWCFRVPSGTARKGKYFIRQCPAGTPDIWTEYGWLEVKISETVKKNPRSKTMITQSAFRDRAAKTCGRVMVESVDSVGSAIQVVSKWQSESKRYNL